MVTSASTATGTYPTMNCDPRDKGYEWILAYTKAAWHDANGMPVGCYYRGNNGKYDELKTYALGKPPINRFKKTPTGLDISDTTPANIDWTYIPMLCKFREIALSKLMQREYDLECFLVDSLAKTESDSYFDQMKVKIKMREQLLAAGSPLADSPLLRPNANEPQDMEELTMRMEFGYKHNLAMDAEMGIDLVMQQNNIYERRKRTLIELFDIGLGGYKEWIDENGLVKFRETVAKNLVVSYCTKNDFSDAVHIGEVLPTLIADIVGYFTPKQIDEICEKSKSQWGNPPTYIPYNQIGTNWNLFKVMVLDLEFLSWNTTVYKAHTDGKGNQRFEKTDYKNIQFTPSRTVVNASGELQQLPTVENDQKGQPTAKFSELTRKVAYRTKWIIGTDIMYDYGLAQNMNRKYSSWWDTSLSYHLYAWDFYEMRFSGMLERLLPISDAYNQTWVKLQALKSKLMAYLIYLDLDALDTAALGKGGLGMSQKQLIDFMFQHQVLAFRSSGGVPGNPNYKPAWIEATGQLEAFTQLYADLVNCVNMMYEVSGLNPASAFSPDPKQSVPGTEAALQSTNNALYMISEADRCLHYTLADAIMCKIQIAVKLGKVEGYVKALGTNTVKLIQLSPDTALREIGIFIRDAMTKEQKQELYMELNANESQGFLDVSDRIFISSCRNMKQAWVYLNYKVNKNKQIAQQNQLQQQQVIAQANGEAAMKLEQLKQQNAIMLLQGQMQLENLKGEWQYRIESMKKASDREEGVTQAEAKVISAEVQAQAKIASTQMAGSVAVIKSHMDNETSKETAKYKKQPA